MGYFLNNEEPYVIYQEAASQPYFVDKSEILKNIFPLIDSTEKYICITRPRRFGKTIMANLIGSFFSKARKSKDIFDSLKISRDTAYNQFINQYNVIYIDFSDIDDECKSYLSYIRNIKSLLREDLHSAYPDITFRENGSVAEDLKRIYAKTHEKFVFILDEWDAIFHMPFIKEKDKESYLRFLKGLLKGKAYVSFAYMTGILPIAKYSSGSELNMFVEFTMATTPAFSSYFGFTETEVDILFDKYLKICDNPAITRDGLKTWYDGYQTADNHKIYNPRSVILALKFNHLESYWTSSGPFDEISYYIRKNIADVRDDLAIMISGNAVPAKVQEYAATSMELNTKDEIFSAMVVYGFLSHYQGKVSIPNKELMDKFGDMVEKEPSLGYIHRLAKESDRMLNATLAGDTVTMCEILEYAHDTEIPLLSYNHEIELTALLNLVYLSARDSYRIEREDKAGIGYVDFIFYPETDKSADCIILELKINSTPKEAISQIKKRKYDLRFKGNLGKKSVYTGRILAVGISYDRKTKKHDCLIEVL